MKKILVLVLVLVAGATASFATNPTEYNAFFKVNEKTAFNSLVGYISADQDQVKFLKHVFEVTESELKNAEAKNSDSDINNVISYNLRNTKFILSEEQYKKYLTFMNYYLKNDNNYATLK